MLRKLFYHVSKILSWKKSKRHSQYYEGLDELPLEVFCRIVNAGNYLLLKRDGRGADEQYCLSLWGDLMLEYSKLDGSNHAKANFEKLAYIKQMENAYATIKSMIRVLWLVSPSHEKHGEKASEYINDLKKMGYKINITSSLEYRASLVAADKKANAIVTYINLKKNELERGKITSEDGVDYDSIMAMLMQHFNINGDITVKRYLACKKIIGKKYAKDTAK